MKIRVSMISLSIAIVALILAIVLPIVIQGPQGIQGPVGPTGLTGATGAQGPNGSVGPNGTVGPQGEKGDKGDNGSQGPIGVIRGSWVLVGDLVGTSESFNLSLGMNSPIKVTWSATALDNDSVLIVKLIGDTSGDNAIWTEVAFSPHETKRGVETTLLNPSESFTLSMVVKAGDLTDLHASVYRFVTAGL